jgi:hypothetical protein
MEKRDYVDIIEKYSSVIKEASPGYGIGQCSYNPYPFTTGSFLLVLFLFLFILVGPFEDFIHGDLELLDHVRKGKKKN